MPTQPIQTKPAVTTKPVEPRPTGPLTTDKKPATDSTKKPAAPEKKPTPATPTYTYLVKLTIGEKTFQNTKGDFIGAPLIQLRTRQYSRAMFVLNDPNGDVWPQIKAAEGQEVQVEIGYPPDRMFKKITGNLWRIGRKFPIGVEVEVVDSSAQLNQATGASVAIPEAAPPIPATPGTATTAATPASPATPGAVQAKPTTESVKLFAQSLNQAERSQKQPDSATPLGKDAITQQQLANSVAASGGVSQKPVAQTKATQAGLPFENRTPTASGQQGTATLSQPGLTAQTKQLQTQGDVVIAKGDGSIAQVAAGQGKKTDIILDWKVHKGAFVRPPTVSRKTPYQFPSSVTVRGWSMADGGVVGATVVTPTTGTDNGATVQVPELGAIKFSDLVYPGSKYTWGDSANQDVRRRPRSKEVAQQIVRIAKLLEELEKKWNGGKKMTITSWYRPPEINNAVSSSGMNGPHTTGNAVDVWFTPSQLIAMHSWLDKNWNGGVAIHPAVHQGAGFVHIDFGERRRWSY